MCSIKQLGPLLTNYLLNLSITLHCKLWDHLTSCPCSISSTSTTQKLLCSICLKMLVVKGSGKCQFRTGFKSYTDWAIHTKKTYTSPSKSLSLNDTTVWREAQSIYDVVCGIHSWYEHLSSFIKQFTILCGLNLPRNHTDKERLLI